MWEMSSCCSPVIESSTTADGQFGIQLVLWGKPQESPISPTSSCGFLALNCYGLQWGSQSDLSCQCLWLATSHQLEHSSVKTITYLQGSALILNNKVFAAQMLSPL